VPWCGPFEPGGRIILEDDNHGLLRLWPPLKPIDDLWQAYIQTWESLGNDPFVGRRLTTLLRNAQAEPRRSDMLFFGGCAGEAFVANFAGILEGAREAIIGATGWTGPAIDEALAAFQDWSSREDAVLWYATCWAEGIRPGELTEAEVADRPESGERSSSRAELAERLETDPHRSLLEFLTESAEDLSSTLRLEQVVARAASGSAQEIADALMAATEEHCLGGEGEVDDRTIVVLRAL